MYFGCYFERDTIDAHLLTIIRQEIMMAFILILRGDLKLLFLNRNSELEKEMKW